MIYQICQAHEDLWHQAQLFAGAGATWLGAIPRPFVRVAPLQHAAAVCEMVAGIGVRHERPAFAIERTTVAGKTTAVSEEVVCATPFATLLRFAKEGISGQPRVLLVAPMAGHFATLLRDAVRTMLPEHEVYLTDWHNARDVPLSEGPFGLDDYIAHLIDFLDAVGPGSHLVAVCQPCVAALAAVAVMAEDGHRSLPRTLTLMAGPIDTRIRPTQVNRMAQRHSRAWYEASMIGTVSLRHPGAGRRVYPGFVQLARFMGMNPARHHDSMRRLYRHLMAGEAEQAQAIRVFYDEYLAVSDLPAEFFLETMQRVFQEQALARGSLSFRGRRVDPGRIRSTPVLAVEGELDDICGIGQTAAALGLCTGLPAAKKKHHLQPGAGHFGVFSGRRWAGEVYPVVRAHLRRAGGPTAPPR